MSCLKIAFLAFLFLIISCKNQEENPALDANLEQAENLFATKQYRKAYYYYNQSFLFNKEQNNTKRAVFNLLRMAHIENLECDYIGSEATTTQAIKLFDKTIPVPYQTNAYNSLGLNYMHLANYEEAKKMFEKAIQITEDSLTVYISKNNIGYLYIKQKEYQKAVRLLSEIENKKILQESPLDYARVLDNKGIALFHLNDKLALSYLKKAKTIRETNNDDSQIVSSYMHLAEYYKNQEPATAKEWTQKAYHSATKAFIPDDRLEALNLLFTTTTNNDLKNQYHDTYIHINDSLQQARQQAKNQFAKIKYDSEKAETEKTAYQYKMYGFIVLLILSVAVFILLYRLTIQRNKRKILETQYTTETKIAKRLHDELANDVHNTIAFAETQNLEDQQNKETLLDNLDTIYQRARNISNENKEINTGKNYLEQLKHMINAYSSDTINVILNTSALHEVPLNSEIKIALYRVLQELMVNMKKHSNCSLVMISFKETNSALEINYSDNGKGTDNQLQIKNGLQNVENRIFSINGNITFDTEPNKGFKVKITIPK
ncbi:tetratricopeptide repeat-containing sensor histidine kinase [Flavobacterium lacisediminis]|uniref:histidine kinase n=1 Tax=Flavobacterium lacisediminis TaxID=2989705 RepID=A0ABT3EID2_9FLAO|nr:tetratricopeptide repeat protein [Flavobacterium lacisediminis]MCW1148323.1 tetratricopeptide repeat protein [Flavobacterium lacisediminis]